MFRVVCLGRSWQFTVCSSPMRVKGMVRIGFGGRMMLMRRPHKFPSCRCQQPQNIFTAKAATGGKQEDNDPQSVPVPIGPKVVPFGDYLIEF